MNHIRVVLILICLPFIIGARPMLRGYPLGSVTLVEREMSVVSVDLGANDGVLKGMEFSVVGPGGRPVASITADEVYPDMFWSGKLKPEMLGAISDGMEVRWVFTPEVSAVLLAKKQNTVEGYAELVRRFPNSRYLPDIINALPDDMLSALNTDYFYAHKAYTKEAFQAVIAMYPGTGYANAAEAEIKAIEAFESEGARIRQERAKKAAESEAAQRHAQPAEGPGASGETAARKGVIGKLTNNSDAPVRFVFDPPGAQGSVTVSAHASSQIMSPTGSYTYKVYKVEDAGSFATADSTPAPIKEGSVSIDFDMWEVVYP